MSAVRPTDEVIALFVSDIHLSLKPPAARAGEPDWFAAMAKPLGQLKRLADRYKVPIFCAGDLFDRWNSPPELINFALEHVPHIYCIPGQHDLPYHDFSLVKRSAYWTLVEAGKIKHLTEYSTQDLFVMASPWGKPLYPAEADGVCIAIQHRYVYKGKGHPGASEDANVRNLKDELGGYTFAMFGDNHGAFEAVVDGTMVINCGCFMRRKADEAEYTPRIVALTRAGMVRSIPLDTSGEVIEATTEDEIEEDDETDVSAFLDELNSLGHEDLDFRDAVLRMMNKKNVSDGVRRTLLEAMCDG